ncbi:MAG: MFS transporter [Verrucomicrobia bacterium]|nr:MFS transporter [Verrucomicrobiota bacterium]
MPAPTTIPMITETASPRERWLAGAEGAGADIAAPPHRMRAGASMPRRGESSLPFSGGGRFPLPAPMQELLRDARIRRLLLANTCSAVGTGITVFAVPWLLVQQPGGSTAYRWATVATTLALFVAAPYYGAWVDAHSRKSALLLSELWSAASSVILAGLGFALDGFGTGPLVAAYFAGMLYYTLHYPAKFALIQQTFDRSHYQSLIGLLEIQGQAAMMLAGALAGLLLGRVPLSLILAVNAAAGIASYLLLRGLPYTATHLGPTTAPAPASVWHGVAEGGRWLLARPRLAVFFTCTLLPFVVVMAANYLFPVYVSQTLAAGPEWFAGGEITFAAGAILAGLLLPRLISRHSAAATVPVTMLVFLAGLLLLAAVHLPLPYLCAGALLGFGNAGCRVARSALLLHLVPNAVMGRVGGFY